MPLYFQRIYDRRGQLLQDRSDDLPSVEHALARANQKLGRVVVNRITSRFDPHGRIDIEDADGRAVARIVCREAIAAMS